MGNATMLNMIAAGHAMGHAEKKEPWTCQCLACRFTKEYKLRVQEANGDIKDMTIAEALLKSMAEQGYHTTIPK